MYQKMSKDLILAGLIDLAKVTHFICRSDNHRDRGLKIHVFVVTTIVTTFAFPAMNNKENETGYKFSKDQTLEKMYVLMD